MKTAIVALLCALTLVLSVIAFDLHRIAGKFALDEERRAAGESLTREQRDKIMRDGAAEATRVFKQQTSPQRP